MFCKSYAIVLWHKLSIDSITTTFILQANYLTLWKMALARYELGHYNTAN